MFVPVEHTVALQRVHRLFCFRPDRCHKRHVIAGFCFVQYRLVYLACGVGQCADRFPKIFSSVSLDVRSSKSISFVLMTVKFS